MLETNTMHARSDGGEWGGVLSRGGVGHGYLPFIIEFYYI